MPVTKTLQFDKDVLDELVSLEWENNYTHAKIGRQLDRRLYAKVDKALEAMGGKWNTKAKAHIFPSDPREQVDGLVNNGYVQIENYGFFSTPLEVVKIMAKYAGDKLNGRLLEPSAGTGEIIGHVYDLGYRPNDVLAVELHQGRASDLGIRFLYYDVTVENRDFLKLTPYETGLFDAIMMNPPFENKQDVDHVTHALRFLTEDGVLCAVMSGSTPYRTDARTNEFIFRLDQYGGEFHPLPEKSFRGSGTDVNTVLLVVKS